MANQGYMSEFQGKLRSVASPDELADLLGDTGGGGPEAVTWANVTGKPTEFPPASHTHTAAQVSDATATGRSVITATDAAAARTAIGAGTSSLVVGTGAAQAAAGNHTHTAYATTAALDALTTRVQALEDAAGA